MNIKKLLFIFFSMALLAAIPYAAFAADDDFMWQDEDKTAYTAPAAKKSVSNKKKTKAMSANASKSAKKRLNKKNKRNNTALNDDAASEKSVLSNKNKPAAQTAKIKKSRKKTSDEIDQLPLPPPPKKKNKEDSLLPSKDKKENSGTEKKTESSSEPGEPDYEAWDREYQEALAAEEAKKKQEQAAEEDSEPRELNYKMLSGWETDSRDGRGAAFSMKKNSASFVVNEKKESCDSKLILKEVNAEHKKFKQRDRPSKVKAYAIKNGVSGYYFNIDDDRSKHYFAFICAGSKTLSITLKNAESDSVFQEAMKSLQMEKISSKNKKNAEKPTLKPVVYMTDILVR